jgi:hypothetical protein
MKKWAFVIVSVFLLLLIEPISDIISTFINIAYCTKVHLKKIAFSLVLMLIADTLSVTTMASENTSGSSLSVETEQLNETKSLLDTTEFTGYDIYDTNTPKPSHTHTPSNTITPKPSHTHTPSNTITPKPSISQQPGHEKCPPAHDCKVAFPQCKIPIVGDPLDMQAVWGSPTTVFSSTRDTHPVLINMTLTVIVSLAVALVIVKTQKKKQHSHRRVLRN